MSFVRTKVVSSNTIKVSWAIADDGGNPLVRYSLKMLSDLNGVGELLLDDVALEYRVKDLMPETSYWLSVIAHSTSGDSGIRWSVETTTNPSN